jgi:hypothetical protein
MSLGGSVSVSGAPVAASLPASARVVLAPLGESLEQPAGNAAVAAVRVKTGSAAAALPRLPRILPLTVNCRTA